MEQKTLMMISSVVSMVGTFFAGYYGPRGIPKSGDIIRAPRPKATRFGWLCIFLGFLLNLVALYFF